MIDGVRLQWVVNIPGWTAIVKYMCGNLHIWKGGRTIFHQNSLLHTYFKHLNLRQRSLIGNSSVST